MRCGRPANVNDLYNLSLGIPMLHIKRILYATDFSKSAQQALIYALDLAVRLDARLDVLHVLQSKAPYSDKGRVPLRVHNIDARLREEVQGQLYARHPGSSASMEIDYTVQRRERVPAAIVGYAEALKVDLIVMGTHGRSGISRLFIGSVAEDVIRTAPCPVIPVRAYEEDVSRAVQMERILVPIDFSTHAVEVLRIAREIATCYGAQLDLLHIIDPMARPEFYDTGLRWLRNVEMRLQATVWQQLETLYEEAGGSHIAMSAHAFKGSPADKIIDFARANDAGLIVMAHRGLTGMQRLMLGSVTECVLREAHCPVLVSKPSGKAPLRPEATTASSVTSLPSFEQVREHVQ